MNIIKRIAAVLGYCPFRKYYKISAPKNLRQCFVRSFTSFLIVLIGWSFLAALGVYSIFLYTSKWLILLGSLFPVMIAPFIEYYTRNDSK